MKPPPDAESPEAQGPAEQVLHMAASLWQWHYGDFSPTDSWSPAINVYRLGAAMCVCVDLAGVDRATIDVRVQLGRLTVRGFRQAPEPPVPGDQPLRIVSMEIDHGPFCRVINLPEQVELHKVESRYQDGLLWIDLPLRKNA